MTWRFSWHFWATLAAVIVAAITLVAMVAYRGTDSRASTLDAEFQVMLQQASQGSLFQPTLRRSGRWIRIVTSDKFDVWVDSVTLKRVKTDSWHGWLRWAWRQPQVAANGARYRNTTQSVRVACRDRAIAVEENLAYNDSGEVVFTGESIPFESVAPNTIGEGIVQALCR